MTVPSILAMYGIVLAYIRETESVDFDIWSEKIILTPILFTAFWNIAGKQINKLNIKYFTYNYDLKLIYKITILCII